MHTFEKIDAAVGRVSFVLAVFASTAVATIAVLLLTTMFRRNLISEGTLGTVEIVELALVAAIFLSLAQAERLRTHVRIGLFTSRMKTGVARVLRFLMGIIAVIVMTWIAYASALAALKSVQINEYSMGLIQFPIWPSKILIFVGVAWFALELVLTTIRDFMRPQEAAEHAEAQASGKGTVL